MDLDMKHNKTVEVHISEVKAGDTILHNGKCVTVGSKFIKNDPFVGVSIYGDNYKGGRKLVTKFLFKKWIDGTFVGWFDRV